MYVRVGRCGGGARVGSRLQRCTARVTVKKILSHADKILFPQICECVGVTLTTVNKDTKEKNEIVLGKYSTKSERIHGKTSNLVQNVMEAVNFG